MAWRAWVSQPIGVTAAGLLSIVVDYYDDADAANAGAGMIGPGNGTASASTDLITITNHGLLAGNQVVLTALTGGAGLAVGVPYNVIATGLTANTFSVAQTANGTAVNITSNATAVTAFKLVPPAAVLWSKAWDLASNTSTAQLQAAVVAEGQKARDWVTARDGARVSVPVGTNIPVP